MKVGRIVLAGLTVMAATGVLAADPVAASPGAVSASLPPPVRSPGEAVRALPDDGLLRAMRDSYVALIGERGRARKVLGELNAVRYDQRLAALPPGPGSDEARARLLAAWYRRFEAVGGPQRIDPRSACRSQERTLREAMAGEPGSPAGGRLPVARAEAQRCLGRLLASLELARSTGRELDAILAEAQVLLAEARPTDAPRQETASRKAAP